MANAITVADILERETKFTMAKWLARVNAEPEIISVPLSPNDRTAHLPALFTELVARLRERHPLGTSALPSEGAIDHGAKRRAQGYTAAMMVEESRMLQVSIFETLQSHQDQLDMGIVMLDVMTIADEVDSQLAQAMASYTFEADSNSEPEFVAHVQVIPSEMVRNFR